MNKNQWMILAFLLFAQTGGLTAGFLKVQGTAIVDSAGQEVILKGFGLGGWLVQEGYQVHIPGFGSPSDIESKITDLIGTEAAERFYQAYVGNYVTESDIDSIAAWGFNSIRLPFHYRMFEPEGQIGIRPEPPIEFLDRVLGWCKKNGLYLILDMHCAPGGQNAGNISDSDGITAKLWTESDNRDRTVEIWREIAARYRDEPWIGGYDLLNETVLPAGHSTTELRALFVRIVRLIREVDPNHILFIEGNWYATDFTSLSPAFDANMAYSFHKYWNAVSRESIQNYLNLRTHTKRPLWLGETGENSNIWFADCVRLMEENGIGWNWWTHKKIQSLTCPYSAPISTAYRAVLDYWNGSGPRPSKALAESALMDMAEKLKSENCEFRPDVVDALIRQPGNPEPKPYGVNRIPGVIQAVAYDFGGSVTSYSDKVVTNIGGSAVSQTVWNSGGEFRNDGVDIEKSGRADFPFNVGWMETGEWMQYTAYVTEAGTYDVRFTVASTGTDGRIRLLMDGPPVSGTLSVPNTGGWKTWREITATGLILPAGQHAFRVETVQGGFNLLKMEFILTSPSDVETKAGPPDGFEILPNFPNPFNGSTMIPIRLSRPANVSVRIYNLKGECVQVLWDGRLDAGTRNLYWDGNDADSRSLPSGVYLGKIRVGTQEQVVKLIMQK